MIKPCSPRGVIPKRDAIAPWSMRVGVGTDEMTHGGPAEGGAWASRMADRRQAKGVPPHAGPEYVIGCNRPGHFEAGMKAVLVVT